MFFPINYWQIGGGVISIIPEAPNIVARFKK